MKNKIVVTIALLLFTCTGYSQAGKVLSVVKLDETNSIYVKNNLDDFFKKGIEVTNIGDLDKDGISELATYGGIENGGLILILYLNRDGTIKKHTIIGENIGGINSDFSNDNVNFGRSISNMGDLDGDGVHDIIVGNHGTSFGGEFYILYLTVDGTVKKHKRISSNKNGFNVSLSKNQNFGVSVENIGDINGDGIIDIAVGDDLDDDGGNRTGAVYILFMDSNYNVGSIQKISELQGGFMGFKSNMRFGNSVAKLDSNRIIVGSIKDSSNGIFGGSIWVLKLDSNGKVKKEIQISEGKSGFSDTLTQLAYFGSSIDIIGDIDGDNNNDLLVGAWGYNDLNKESGASFLLFMNPDGTVKDHRKYSNSFGEIGYTLDVGSAFGSGVAGMGDLDGDGKLDIAIGAFGLPEFGRGGIHIFTLDGKDHGNGIGVSDIEKKNISLFPNPATNTFKLELGKTQSGGKVTITDVSGKVLWNTNAYNGEDIPVSKLSSGLYHVNLVVNNEVFYNKLIVQ